MNGKIKLCALAIFAAAFAVSAKGEICNLKTSQDVPARKIEMEFRTPAPQEIKISSVKIGERELSPTEFEWKPYAEYGKTAYVFLFDTSENGGIFSTSRNASIKELSKIAGDVMRAFRDRQRFALYSYSDGATKILKLPQTPIEVIGALGGLKANAKNNTPALFKALSESIEDAKKFVAADRRIVFVFGTGKSSDVTYTIDTVMRSAKDANVIVCAVGKAESEDEQGSLQNYTRLVSETKGKFYQLPVRDGAALKPAEFFDAMESGGKVVVKIPTDADASKKLHVKFSSNDSVEADISAFGMESDRVNTAELLRMEDAVAKARRDISAVDAAKKSAEDAAKSLAQECAKVSDSSGAADWMVTREKIAADRAKIEAALAKAERLFIDADRVRQGAEKVVSEQAARAKLDADKKKIEAAKLLAAKLDADIKKIEAAKSAMAKILSDSASLQNEMNAKWTRNVAGISAALSDKEKLARDLEKLAKSARERLDSITEKTKAEEIKTFADSENENLARADKAIEAQKKEFADAEKKLSLIDEKLKVSESKAASDSEKSSIRQQRAELDKASVLLGKFKGAIDSMAKSRAELSDTVSKLTGKYGAASGSEETSKKILLFSGIAVGLAAVVLIIAFLRKNAAKKKMRLDAELERIRLEEERALAEASREPLKKFASLQTVDASNTVYDITSAICRLGRKQGNDIIFANDSVSGHHAEINFKGGECHIIDLSSSNGTFVNGRRIQSAIVKDGDTIELGTEVKLKISVL